jgi:hypothetical protein
LQPLNGRVYFSPPVMPLRSQGPLGNGRVSSASRDPDDHNRRSTSAR